MSIAFAAPIPGQSLTAEPRNLPFERPPEITDPLEALDMHVENITRPQAMKDAFYFLEEGLDMVSLVEGILRSAVMAGLHSIDVSLAIAPALHEYILSLALDADIEFDEGFEKPDQDKGIQYARDRSKALKMLEELRESDGEGSIMEEHEEPEEMTMEQEEPLEEAPRGLMART